MTDMTLDEAVKWLRGHVGDLRSSARELRKSPWRAKLADTAAAVDRVADKGILAIAALEAAREDAERYRCLSAMATQQADYLGPIFRIDVRRSEPYLFNFDAAVDAAMRKEDK